MQITGDSKHVEGEFMIVYAGQSFTVNVAYELGSWPTSNFTRHEAADRTFPNHYITQIVNSPSVNGSEATIIFEVVTQLQ